MGSREHRRTAVRKPRKSGRKTGREADGDEPETQPAVDTWVKLGYEIVRLVLPHRGRTVNLILLLTVPASVIAAVLVTTALVLVPHPPLALGALASGLGVYGVSRLRLRRLARAAAALEGAARAPGRSAAAGDTDGSADPATLPPP